MTVASSRRLDALDQWCLRRIVHIPYTAHITNEEVRRRTGQPQSPQLSQRHDFVCSDILREPTHHKTTLAFLSSHQSSSSGLATSGRSTKADMALYNRASGHCSTFGSTTLVSTQRGCVSRIVQSGVIASACGDGYAHWWARYSMMMMMMMRGDSKYTALEEIGQTESSGCVGISTDASLRSRDRRQSSYKRSDWNGQ